MARKAIEIIDFVKVWHNQNRGRKCSDIDWIALEALIGIPVTDPLICGKSVLSRVEQLEILMAELIASKRKRSEYMKDYMRKRRSGK